jgi:hypothetical protein
MNKIFNFSAIFLFCWTLGNLKAQTTTNSVTDPAIGLQYTIPNGWIGQQIDGGYLFGSNSVKGFLLITYHQYKTLDEIRAEAAQGIADENGTMLTLSGSLVAAGKNGLAGTFTGTVEWQKAKAYAASLVSPFGTGGITILAAVEEASYSPAYQGYVESVVKSVSFSKSKVTPIAQQWKKWLNNSRLTYMNSYNSGYGGGGYQDKTIIDLCSAGYFRYNDHSETVLNAGDYAGGYSSGSSNGSGQWKVVSRGNQAVLQLVFSNGELYEYTLRDRDGKTYLNDNRYFLTYGDSSVESARPNCF